METKMFEKITNELDGKEVVVEYKDGKENGILNKKRFLSYSYPPDPEYKGQLLNPEEIVNITLFNELIDE